MVMMVMVMIVIISDGGDDGDGGDGGEDGDSGDHDDDDYGQYTSCIGGASMVGRAADKPMLREPRWTTSVGRSCNHFQLSIFCCNQQVLRW